VTCDIKAVLLLLLNQLIGFQNTAIYMFYIIKKSYYYQHITVSSFVAQNLVTYIINHC